ncbi:MAG: hypothetical protein JXQ87_17555 [Bacteroidia bacterium]
MDHFLVEFETAFQKGKGKLHWAFSADNAFHISLKIIEESGKNAYYIEQDPALREITLKERLEHRANLNALKEPSDYNVVYISGCAFASCDLPTALFTKKGTSKFFLAENVTSILIITIDQLVPMLVDLHAIAPLLCQSANNSFELISLLNSNKVNVIIVDNGRSKLLSLPIRNRLLELGHPKYFLKEFSDAKVIEALYYGHLGENDPLNVINEFALDGYGQNTMLLDIPVDEIVVAGREEKAEKDKTESDLIWRSWKSAMLSRKVLKRSRFGPISLMKSFYKRGFGKKRTFPNIEKGSFSEQWLKQRPNVVESRKLTDIPKGQLLVRKPATDGLND